VQRNIRVRLELPEEPGESMAAQDVLEYPLAAIREMIVNMVAHRDYYNVVPSHLMIFDDRIVVENPGGLLPGLSLKMLENRHRPRNPRLIEMLHTMGYVERFGSGIGRMRRAMQEAKLPEPLFEADESYFRVTLRNSPAKIEVAVALPGNPPSKTALAETPVAPAGREAVLLKRLPLARLKNRQVEALRYIMRQGKINNAQYRALTGLAVDATLNDLRELLDLKLVIKVGVTGRAVYYILNPELEKD
jgi:ATP-dependent DNA helicase RecG